MANSLAAIDAGARHLQGTINGLGERCGNANLISIIPTFLLKKEYSEKYDISIDVDKLSELKNYDGKNVILNGWVYNIRSIGKIWFLILRDGSGLVQCVVVDKETDKSTFELENILTQESSISIEGVVRAEPRSVGGYELGVKKITVHQIADEYPISHKEHGADFLMSNRHLWLRSKNQNAILKVRHLSLIHI